jgi:uncharacterized protein
VTHPVFRDQDALAGICRRYHIRRLSLFGSTVKGSDRPDSDVDLLVEFQPDAKPSLLHLSAVASATPSSFSVREMGRRCHRAEVTQRRN